MTLIKVMFRKFDHFWSECKLLSYMHSRFPSAVIEPRVLFKGDPANLKLGFNVQIHSGTVLHLGGMDWCNHSGAITIGDDSVVSPNCVIYGCGSGGVHIGKRFDCGPNVSIFASRSDYSKNSSRHVFKPVHIGDDVTVFANVVISPGVVIGSGAVIAAGSVVTNDVPDNSLVGGSPATVIRKEA